MDLQLKALRDRRGLSIKQMYQRLGVKDSRYRKWESGAAAIPIEYAAQASDILRCSLDELAGRAAPELEPDERRLLDLYRSTDARGKAAIMRTAEGEAGVEGPSAGGLTDARAS